MPGFLVGKGEVIDRGGKVVDKLVKVVDRQAEVVDKSAKPVDKNVRKKLALLAQASSFKSI
ncbi:hypothetical protein ACO1D1_06175 [Neobacillus sp. 19]